MDSRSSMQPFVGILSWSLVCDFRISLLDIRIVEAGWIMNDLTRLKRYEKPVNSATLKWFKL